MTAVTDEQAKRVFSENVQRLLAEQGRNVHWLMLQTNENANRIYPAVRGETNVTVGLMTRIALALGVTLNDLVEPAVTVAASKRAKQPPKVSSRNLEKIA